ncbi:MAG: hypothetical protein CL681_27385 [Blastopirellula sp.]|nr:hypothetical protein [Blastopirellula sp.]
MAAESVLSEIVQYIGAQRIQLLEILDGLAEILFFQEIDFKGVVLFENTLERLLDPLRCFDRIVDTGHDLR